VTYRAGRHFLQLPGPTNVPDRILRAMDRAVIDHRGPEFGRMTMGILEGLMPVFRTSAPVFVFPSSGSGAWEAALVNTLSPGDRVCAFDQGFFADRWALVARRMGLEVERLPGDWRRQADPDALEARLTQDGEHQIAAVLVVHNETSTGVTSDIGALREAMDRCDHPALLMVDAVSSLAAMPVERDAWRVDVVVAGSQKGLMLPPGLSFNAVSDLALAANETATLPRAYWDWAEMARFNEAGYFPSTPATTLLYGLAESLTMLEEEGLEAVFRRHARHAHATRLALDAWGLENHCADPAGYSSAGTTVLVPDGTNANVLRHVILERFDMSLGGGLGPLEGRVFRIGHLGDFNDLMLAGSLSGVEMGLEVAGVPHRPGGVRAALAYLAGEAGVGTDRGELTDR
jgi:alanine-glyoxylate transaminase/serine-glyoxylate transaminase/serine-pyruvate transaminase